ncbi:hypothetical protein [Ruegeria sp. HKCCA4008]|uniref:hypothetical protein n=1 Tax=Ruegeria sp. HKCCA4008 TaxID=2682999 RepID=UPI001489C349|nr:hypothetical protein [Ruegeria sp. HKCCA4008]
MLDKVKISTGGEVSLQVVQDVYNDITGRTERLSRYFFDAHQIEFSDIENLHRSIQALMEQYHCVGSNCSITIRYIDEKTERVSSFQKFAAQGATRNECIEQIEIEYNFLILLPKTSEAKPYSLEIGLRNTMALPKKMEDLQASDIQRRLSFDSMRLTGRMAIEYVDLAVARSIEAQVEDWYSGLRKQCAGRVHSVIKKAEKATSIVIQGLGAFAVCSVLLMHFNDYPFDLQSLFRAGVVSLFCVILTIAVSRRIGFYAENQIARLMPLSLIQLTQADAELVAKNAHTTGKTIGRVGLSTLSTVMIGLITAYLASVIGL